MTRIRHLWTYHDPGQSARRKEIYAAYELWYTVVDVGAALSFLAGSILFLSDATKTLGTYLFIVGSALFLMKPAIRLTREAQYAAHGDADTLARRVGWQSSTER
ncbi:YrhK family protein [Aliihoeflea sp. 40Bstr573]|uniref:YrhK family protein n=1 Tax=Aliihoeflea sp. 40Bstr573 TaxID=2696467 RepID=UPI002095F6DE|nr:YrhK family protein [Aliihoeflea sp. 40Bstr573]MCO6387064.1 hypothetical protein [Aliihoeflea sp. 40Bstr573]